MPRYVRFHLCAKPSLKRYLKSSPERPSARYPPPCRAIRKVADVWEKDVWKFQAKSGSSGSCRLFLHFPGKIAVRKMSGRTPGSRRHPSSRHPRPSEQYPFEIVSQRGVSHAFCLVFMCYRASIAEIALLLGGGGCRASTLHALQVGKA